MSTDVLPNHNDGEVLRILFVRPGGYFMGTEPPDAPMIGPPRSIVYLSGVFKDDPAIQMKFLDVLAGADFEKILQEKFEAPIYFGISDDNIVRYLNDYNPHIISITSTANYFFNEVVRFVNLASSVLPEAFLMLGGPDATNDFQEYFGKSKDLDCVVMREGEAVFRNLVNALRNRQPWKNIRGIAYRAGEQVLLNENEPYIQDLDSLICNYELFDMERYFEINSLGFPPRLIFKYPGSNRSIDLVTSRGCPSNCSFCCIHLHMGRTFRAHSADRILSDMKYLIEKHDVRNFLFEDDNLLHDKQRFISVLRGIVKNEWNITWSVPNGIRADHVDQEFLELCRKTGCTYLIFGVESGCQEVHNRIIMKNLNLDDVISACRLCYEYEIDTMAFYIFGLPEETKEDLEKTYSFAFNLFDKYNTTPFFQLWRPYRNTESEMKVRQLLEDSQKNIRALCKEHGIPFILFYSKLYESGDIDIKLLSNLFNRYLINAEKYMFRNWLKIVRRKPSIFMKSLFQILAMSVRAHFSPSRNRSILLQYIASSGMMPFSMIHELGHKK